MGLRVAARSDATGAVDRRVPSKEEVMRKIATLAAVLAAVAAAAVSSALESDNGSTVTEQATASDIRSAIEYDVSTPEVEWTDMGNFWIGRPGGSGDEAVVSHVGDTAGDVFYVVGGGDATLGAQFRGVVHDDGDSLQHLVQSKWVAATQSGTRIMRVIVSPVTDGGALTAGHPVVMRDETSLGGTEILSVDPADGTESRIGVFELESNTLPSHVAIGSDGTVFVLHRADDTIRTLKYDTDQGAYVEDVVDTSLGAAYGLLVGPDGDLYTFGADQLPWGAADRSEKKIYRVDPSSGSWSHHASVKSQTYVFSWAFGTDGKLWISLKDARKGGRYVTEVVASETTSTDNAVATSSDDPSTVAAGTEGALLVLEHVDFALSDRVYAVTPGSGGGGGGKPPKKPK